MVHLFVFACVFCLHFSWFMNSSPTLAHFEVSFYEWDKTEIQFPPFFLCLCLQREINDQCFLFCFILFEGFEATPGYSWRSLLVLFRGTITGVGIKSRWAVYKTSTLTSTVSLASQTLLRDFPSCTNCFVINKLSIHLRIYFWMLTDLLHCSKVCFYSV